MRRYFVGFNLVLLVAAVALSVSNRIRAGTQERTIEAQEQRIAQLQTDNLRKEMRLRVCEADKAGKVPMDGLPDRSVLNMHPELMTPPFKPTPIPPTPPKAAKGGGIVAVAMLRHRRRGARAGADRSTRIAHAAPHNRN